MRFDELWEEFMLVAPDEAMQHMSWERTEEPWPLSVDAMGVRVCAFWAYGSKRITAEEYQHLWAMTGAQAPWL